MWPKGIIKNWRMEGNSNEVSVYSIFYDWHKPHNLSKLQLLLKTIKTSRTYSAVHAQHKNTSISRFWKPLTWTKDGLNRTSGILNLSDPISIVLGHGKQIQNNQNNLLLLFFHFLIIINCHSIFRWSPMAPKLTDEMDLLPVRKLIRCHWDVWIWSLWRKKKKKRKEN